MGKQAARKHGGRTSPFDMPADPEGSHGVLLTHLFADVHVKTEEGCWRQVWWCVETWQR